MNIRSKVTGGALSIFILFSFSCFRKSELPKEVPDNLEIRYENKRVGNRQPEGNVSGVGNVRSALISGNHMSVVLTGCEEEGEEKGTLTENQINDLYKRFVEYEFDLIENRELPADAEDTDYYEIHLRAGNITKSVKYYEQFPPKEDYKKRFNRLWTELSTLTIRKFRACYK